MGGNSILALAGHFGSRPWIGSDFMALVLGGDSCLAATPGPSLIGGRVNPLAVVVLVAVTVGVLLGWYLHRLWVAVASWISQSTGLRNHRNPWVRVVARALHFIRKRRTISLALSNSQGNSLRNSEGSASNSARRQHLAQATPKASARVLVGELTPLREGPAIQSEQWTPRQRS